MTSQTSKQGKRGLEARLKNELERIGVKLGLNLELRVAWMPNIDNVQNGLAGEVRGGGYIRL